ncbi:thiamine-phosphate kinase [Halorientalis brevis]|uniref:Thiamine-monophosphate kinase n=1 Tax=Halorientalis brevis TaxID=1126241 RepID=A0ABD6C805_9EURY|nr:thiamine-phosphate kinase [Halorientalis brevis]
MDERAALALLADDLPAAGDDAAVVGEQVLTTDMLHDRTDFPVGTTRYTAGWRAVGASLSDVAAMGAEATAAVAVYAAPSFDESELREFVRGARDVCAYVEAEYVGGDLDRHQEFTVSTTVLGRTDSPVRRSGASPGDAVCVTGTLGRSGAAIRLFEQGEYDRANDLFRFTPRVVPGLAVASHATAMIDSSDGLARSLHQLADASDCGFAIERPLPIDEAVDDVAPDEATRRELGVFFGEDFELVFTIPPGQLPGVRDCCDVQITKIGTVTEPDEGLTLAGDALRDRGYTHAGEDDAE